MPVPKSGAGKDAGVWESFAEQLLAHNGHPKAITQVAIDMSPADIKGVRDNFGNATIAFDKFHVVSQVPEAVRRKEVRQEAPAPEQLEKTCWWWRKNPEGWKASEQARWEQLKDKPLVTGLAYAMRLQLQRAYAAASATEARTRFVAWCAWVRAEAKALTSGLLEPRRQTADLIERRLEGIVGHWKQGLTTAFLEGLNSLFSATKRKARGYRSSEYQTARLYFVAGKLEIPYNG